MSRFGWILMLIATCGVPWVGLNGEKKQRDLPRLPGAMLLTGHLPDLALTTSGETLKLQETKDDSISGPTMSHNGELVVFFRGKNFQTSQRGVIAAYSVKEKRFMEYTQLTEGGTAAISPDNSRLALAKRDPGSKRVRLYFIDLKTGVLTVGFELGAQHPYRMSWSPDGRRMALDMDVNRSTATTTPMIPKLRPAIHVLDLENGRISQIADGRSPAWSPSGEWIAYLHYSADKEDHQLGSTLPNPNQACIIRPDGTDSKVLMKLSGDQLFMEAPVWSPDSKSILLNKVYDDLKTTMDIYLVDITILKRTKKFHDAPPVYGWAEAK